MDADYGIGRHGVDMQNSLAPAAARAAAPFSAATTCYPHLVQHNRLHPLIECLSIAAVVDECERFSAAGRPSISDCGPVRLKRDPPARYSYLPPHLHNNHRKNKRKVTYTIIIASDLKLECLGYISSRLVMSPFLYNQLDDDVVTDVVGVCGHSWSTSKRRAPSYRFRRGKNNRNENVVECCDRIEDKKK